MLWAPYGIHRVINVMESYSPWSSISLSSWLIWGFRLDQAFTFVRMSLAIFPLSLSSSLGLGSLQHLPSHKQHKLPKSVQNFLTLLVFEDNRALKTNWSLPEELWPFFASFLIEAVRSSFNCLLKSSSSLSWNRIFALWFIAACF